MRKMLLGMAALSLLATSTTALSAPCRDAKGKFIKCGSKSAKPVRCKNAKGQFAKCGTAGAKPA